ncbi:hypothetical protein [Streptomyces yangpuensis]|uniref:hypothetical protein n=1 Tax=Streptomyces yangpuensis TaxID=1648182 RepID=UPI00381A8240
MNSDKAPKAGAGKGRKASKIAEKSTNGKAVKEYRLPGKSAAADGTVTRKSQPKQNASGQGVRDSQGPSRPALKLMPVKAKQVQPGNVRELQPRKAPHEGWGPFYDLVGASQLLGISPADAEKRGEAHELLMVGTADGGVLFPVWQFTGRRPHSRVAKALAVFRDMQTSSWLVVQWATAPNPQLGGATPIEWLRRNQPLEPVLEDARAYAARWSR